MERNGTRAINAYAARILISALTRSLAIVCVSLLIFQSQAYCQQSAPAVATGPSFGQELLRGGPPGPLLGSPQTPWLQNLHISGLYQNTSGMFVNPYQLRMNNMGTAPPHGATIFTPINPCGDPTHDCAPRNYLATERNLLQTDINFAPDTNDRIFLRFWGVYEPSYGFDQNSHSNDAFALNRVGNRGTASAAADYWNTLEFHEAWWKTSHGPLTVYAGRQIVTWGESLAFRVADVVNPEDLSWNIGFANLEQDRMPLWMLHPILNLPDAGPFSNDFLEFIWVPGYQPAQNNWIYTDNPSLEYAGTYATAGAVNRLPVFGSRFDSQTTLPCGGLGLASQQAFASPGVKNKDRFLDPVALGGDYPQCPVTSNFLNPASVIDWRLPGDGLNASEVGLRLHGLIANQYEVTALYWHGHQYSPALMLRPGPRISTANSIYGIHTPPPLIGAPTDQLVGIFPDLNDLGLTGNSPLVLPGQWSQTLPFVVRGEAVWQDRTPFATRALNTPSGVQYSSTVSTLMALDLDSAYAPWLTQTGTLGMHVEWNNYTVLNPSRFMEMGPLQYQQLRHNEENFIFAVDTSWYWNVVHPNWVMAYNPDGNTMILLPSVTFTPPWTANYFATLRYVNIIGSNISDGVPGLPAFLKGHQLVVGQFQYNFDVL
ncbi:MAG: hypothetical protein IVW54_02185 [Candidatus Binataceae bacterium]|nr:hypothetical protein [Candidatus Binataceae bacterium]